MNENQLQSLIGLTELYRSTQNWVQFTDCFLKISSHNDAPLEYIKLAGDYYISNIAVYPEYRGLGIAKRLLEAVMEKARNAGSKRIILDVEANNREAIGLYTGTGYTSVGKMKPVDIYGKIYTFSRMSKEL